MVTTAESDKCFDGEPTDLGGNGDRLYWRSSDEAVNQLLGVSGGYPANSADRQGRFVSGKTCNGLVPVADEGQNPEPRPHAQE